MYIGWLEGRRMQWKENACEEEQEEAWDRETPLGGRENYGERAIRGGCSNILEPFFILGARRNAVQPRGVLVCVWVVVVVVVQAVFGGGGWMARVSQQTV